MLALIFSYVPVEGVVTRFADVRSLLLLAALLATFPGLGVREGLLIVLLAPFGIGSSSAMTLALLLLSLSIAIGLLGGALEAVVMSVGTPNCSDKPAA